jgi:hypothetical protein
MEGDNKTNETTIDDEYPPLRLISVAVGMTGWCGSALDAKKIILLKVTS